MNGLRHSNPDYENPPLIEVVCGMQFTPLQSFLAAHVGLLWSRFKDDFPNVREVSPLSPVIERFDESDQPMHLDVSDKPPLPRTWFISASENLIIQLQKDRFLHNWRKVGPTDKYLRFENVFASFRRQFEIFEGFIKENQMGDLDCNQYELTYVNIIGNDNNGFAPSEIGHVFRDIQWDKDGRAVPEPESIKATFSFAYPEEYLRLHTTIRTAVRVKGQKPLFRLELTARGMPEDKGFAGLQNWFQTAHNRIVNAFADLTQVRIQKEIWKRII